MLVWIFKDFSHNAVHKRMSTGKRKYEKLTVPARSINKTNPAILETLLTKQQNAAINKQVKYFPRTLKIFYLVFVLSRNKVRPHFQFTGWNISQHR